MANFKNMEMANAIRENKNIMVKSGLFGLGTQLIYQPTGSKIDTIVKDYTPENGNKVERQLKLLAEGTLTKDGTLASRVPSVPVGNMRLEVCIARDHSFAAVQLFGFADFKYHPLTELKFYEGTEASLVADLYQ